MTIPMPAHEQARLAALRRYAILDTPPEAAFDRIVHLAVQVFQVPIALVSFVDHERQWCKACYGLDTRETQRDLSFCTHALLGDEVLVVPDATRDPRFVANPLVTGAPGIRFYAGAPLRTHDGYHLGTLCLLDTTPRAFGPAAQTMLADLAALVIDELDLRRALTQAQQREVALAQANDALERRVAERTAALSQANARLQCERTERTQAEAALRTSEARHRAILATALDAIITIDHTGRICEFNPVAEQVFGYHATEIMGEDLAACLSPPAIRDRQRRGWARYLTTHASPAGGTRLDVTARRADGTAFPVEVAISRIPTVGPPLFTGIIRDLTERKRFEAQLQHQAFHDALTGLPNRALVRDRVQHALARAQRTEQRVAVLMLDLDRFNVVNDTWGQTLGDQLLVAVAQRVQDCVRPGDTVARLAGDEFLLLVEDVADLRMVTQIAERMLTAVRATFSLDGREVVVTASIGIALSTSAVHAPDALLRAAELAMEQAKANGRAQYQLFTERMGVRLRERAQLEADLHHALERGELAVVYQPKVTLTDGRICGFEALLRWHHPTRGLVPPSQFIAIAEETGLILPIGQWVLAQACRQAHAWQAAYGCDSGLTMHVNLSARQFQHPTLVGDVAHVLAATQLAAPCVVLEMTEGVVMDDAATTSATLRQLKALGVQLAIDDFGTGYSSLSYLKRFPFDILKIDQTFVAGVGQDAEDTAIVTAVITLAHTLGMQVVAEGIETATQVAQLQALGCESGQGYYFAKPLTPGAAAALLRGEAGAGAARAALRDIVPS